MLAKKHFLAEKKKNEGLTTELAKQTETLKTTTIQVQTLRQSDVTLRSEKAELEERTSALENRLGEQEQINSQLEHQLHSLSRDIDRRLKQATSSESSKNQQLNKEVGLPSFFISNYNKKMLAYFLFSWF